jgi:hypothetical protein
VCEDDPHARFFGGGRAPPPPRYPTPPDVSVVLDKPRLVDVSYRARSDFESANSGELIVNFHVRRGEKLRWLVRVTGWPSGVTVRPHPAGATITMIHKEGWATFVGGKVTDPMPGIIEPITSRFALSGQLDLHLVWPRQPLYNQQGAYLTLDLPSSYTYAPLQPSLTSWRQVLPKLNSSMTDLLDKSDIADFQVQSGNRPTGTIDSIWWWSTELGASGPSTIAWDSAEDRSKSRDLFLAGIVLGVAGAAIVVVIQMTIEAVVSYVGVVRSRRRAGH